MILGLDTEYGASIPGPFILETRAVILHPMQTK